MANTQRDGTDGRADDGSAAAPSPPGVSLGQGDEVVQGGRADAVSSRTPSRTSTYPVVPRRWRGRSQAARQGAWRGADGGHDPGDI
jgi:hypothetical protein